MAVRKINESTLTAIGNAIRSKAGGSALINPEDMADEIESIETGGGIEHGLEILTFDSNGLPETAKVHGQLTPREFQYLWYNINKRVLIELDENIDHVADYCFWTASIGIGQNSLNRIKTADRFAFNFQSSNAINLASETLFLPEFTGEASAENLCESRFRNETATYYKRIHCPKMQKLGTYDFQNPKVPSWEREVGSIGYPVKNVKLRPFSTAATIGTATIYIDPLDIATIPTAVEANVTAGNVTFIYKSAATGETLQTNVR